MLLQFDKCAFYERPFTGPDESRIEMDLEHYRPKSAVLEWSRRRVTGPILPSPRPIGHRLLLARLSPGELCCSLRDLQFRP